MLSTGGVEADVQRSYSAFYDRIAFRLEHLKRSPSIASKVNISARQKHFDKLM
jgi:hypothetical protein